MMNTIFKGRRRHWLGQRALSVSIEAADDSRVLAVLPQIGQDEFHVGVVIRQRNRREIVRHGTARNSFG